MKPLFIVFDGIDGVGKTTNALQLVTAIQEKRLPVIYTKEPTNGLVGQYIQNVLSKKLPRPDEKTLAIAFAEDRASHIEIIQSFLEDDVSVICDRYIFSNLVYNCHTFEEMKELIEYHKDFYLVPDVVIWLDLPPIEAMQRKNLNFDRGESEASIFETLDTLQDVYYRYDTIFFNRHESPYSQLFNGDGKEARLIHVDADHPCEHVSNDILRRILPLFEEQ